MTTAAAAVDTVIAAATDITRGGWWVAVDVGRHPQP